MASFENLRVEHVYGFNEDAVLRYAKIMHEDFDETEYWGLNPETIASLLDTVGARGDSPLMASILYHAGIEKPLRSRDWLYGEHSDYADMNGNVPKLFGVFADGDSVRRDSVPDALLLAIGFNRKAYRGYELVMTDLWVNPESSCAVNFERDVRDAAQKAMLSGDYGTDYIFVEQDTVIHELGEGEGGTVEERGIQPDEYGGGESSKARYDRMDAMGEISSEHEYYQLLKNLHELYAALELDVEKIGFEGEELYELWLNASEVDALNKLQKSEGTDQITGLSINREDRPPGSFYNYGEPDYETSYSNNWGDMTVIINIERENLATSYTLTVFMEGGDYAFLNKRIVEAKKFSNSTSKGAAHLLSMQEDPMDVAMKINEIDEFEYQLLLKLVRNFQAVTTLT
jgi:hypothetical protein